MEKNKRLRRSPLLTIVPYVPPILLLWFWMIGVNGDLVMDFNKDYLRPTEGETEDLNPCDFTTFTEEPSGYCYCTPEGVHEAEEVRCGFTRNPAEIEWRALAHLNTAVQIQFMSRPPKAIQEVPPYYVFVGMKNLHFFTMKVANVNNVPSFAFGNSSVLAEIDLQDNSIYELLPNSFANLQNLSVINLSENNLTQIHPGVFVNLPKLRDLVLMKNSIHTLHDYAFRELTNLEDLALQNNRLTVITREVFAGLHKMKNLDLQGNQIAYIGDHVFSEMSRLQDLDLSKNGIVSISPKGFAGLSILSRLNLKANKIVRLLPETFSYFAKIHFLDLRNNELETLNYALMKPIYKNLKTMSMQLLVEGNRFSCDCRILWMQTLYNETRSENVKLHLSKTTCDLFENTNKHASTASSSSSTVFRPDGTNSDITILTSPPEETTAYAFESEKNVMNLTSKDLSCPEDVTDNEFGKTNDTPYTYHHQQMIPKRMDDAKVVASSNKVILDLNREINEQNNQMEKNSPEGRNEIFHHHHHRDSNLNEPQATAALEGSDFMGSAPKTSLADQKLDTSRITATHSSSSKYVCDAVVLMVSVCLSVSLK